MAVISGRMLAATLATAGLAACSIFVPLDDYDSETPDAGSVADASVADAGDAGDAASNPRGDSAPPATDAGSLSPYALAVLADQPLLYVRLDDPPGSPTPTQLLVTDAGVDAAIVSGGAYISSAVQLGVPGAIVGDPDTAVSLTGQLGEQQNAISLSDDVRYSFKGETSYSVEVWAKPDPAQIADGGYGRFWSRDEGFDTARQAFTAGVNGGNFFTERITNGDDSHPLYIGSALLDPAAASLPWVHVVVTYDTTTANLSLYADGVLLQTLATNGGSLDFLQATDLILGGEPGTDTASDQPTVYIGALDEFALYARPLDPTTILHHYEIGMGLPPSDAGAPVDAGSDADVDADAQP